MEAKLRNGRWILVDPLARSKQPIYDRPTILRTDAPTRYTKVLNVKLRFVKNEQN